MFYVILGPATVYASPERVPCLWRLRRWLTSGLPKRGAELYFLPLMKRADRRALRDEFSVTHFNVPRSDSCHLRAVRHDDKRGEFFTPDSRQDFDYHLGGF